MFSFMNLIGQFMSSFLTVVFTALFGIHGLLGGTNQPLPVAPDDFTPVVRFAVCSDVHLQGVAGEEREQRLATVFDDAYAYAEGSDSYKALDAVVVVGDYATSGSPEQYQRFNAVVDEHVKEGTKVLAPMGNHEFIDYRDVDASVAYDVYKEYICEDVDTHNVINGYHFITVSYAPDGKTFNGKTSWLRNELKAAKKDTGDMPIFVFQHPQPFGTVYGSVNWGTPQIRAALTGFPQVIDFSGHSHYASSDPRSIWQGEFTALGTGSTAALMSNLNYIEGDEDAPGESGTCWIVEADKDGNVQIKLYDLVAHQFFEQNNYYLTNLASPFAHKYTWGNLKSLDTAPQFAEDAQITSTVDGENNVHLMFPNANGYYPTENYKITISKGLFNTAWSSTVVSNYVRSDLTEMDVLVGELESGTYKVSITPCSPYAKTGKSLTGTITVE